MFKLKDLAPDRNVTINSTVDERQLCIWLWNLGVEIEDQTAEPMPSRN